MYKISEIAKLTGLSVPTLRYYEELGLLKPQRLANNYREFSEADLDWIAFIKRAKQTGMSLENIIKYAQLREQGDATILPRLGILIEQERILMAQAQEIQGHLDFIRQKKRTYYEHLQKND